MAHPTSADFTVNGSQILLDGEPFFVRGVAYSPSPIGINPVTTPPYGDYYTAEYKSLWHRDFPLLVAMGANTIRIYAWNASADHSLFLHTAHEWGLYVIVSFWSGLEQYHPIGSEDQRQALLSSFAANAALYAGYPALLGWIFGNEANGPWNGYMAAFNQIHSCGWNDRQWPADGSGCWFNPADIGACAQPVACVYAALFAFIDQGASRAHSAMGTHHHLVITTFSDVDLVIKRWADWEHAVPNLDVWAAQLYRGYTFGEGDNDFIAQFEHISNKPLLITEYGVDAMDDPCGRSPETPCYNNAKNQPVGYGENEKAQAEWNTHLSSVLLAHSSAAGRGRVAGGCVMGWMDELWKTAISVARCWSWQPYGTPGFDAGQCQYKAHVDCPNKDITQPSLCGFYMDYPYDKYVNEGYWGIMRPSRSSSSSDGTPDTLVARAVYTSLQTLWVDPYNKTWITAIVAVISVALVIVIALCVCARRYRSQQEHIGAGERAPLLPK